ncbi:sporulation protein [Thermoflavimicrobium daqui]|uniref:sporulation protein n=1 Tax=Thermoflavimicrobium daqui TaxID=2137476 RepID=UPI00143D9D5C|nr:sporulation protein [Thermoflavimicrobium daqui]
MFKSFLAKLGHGGAKVDFVLDKSDYALGDSLRGELIVQGGTVEQQINRIDIELVMSIYHKDHYYTQTVGKIPFHTPFKIQPEERKSIPVSYVFPMNLLLSSSSISYYFVSHLDIAGAVDSSDKDFVQVLPPLRLQNALIAFEQIGFYEKHDSRSFNGYLQEFELKPTGMFKDQIEEVEFVVSLEETGIRLLLEVDLYSFFGEKEIRREIWLDNPLCDDPTQLATHLQEILTEMIQNPQSYVFHSAATQGIHKHTGFGIAAGAVGGVAAGLIAAEVIDEIGDALEDVFEGDEEEQNFAADDFFDGDED